MPQGTQVQHAMKELFQMHYVNEINGLRVDFKSSFKQECAHVSLSVEGCRDIYASFDKFCEEVVMDGPNQFLSQVHGLVVSTTKLINQILFLYLNLVEIVMRKRALAHTVLEFCQLYDIFEFAACMLHTLVHVDSKAARVILTGIVFLWIQGCKATCNFREFPTRSTIEFNSLRL